MLYCDKDIDLCQKFSQMGVKVYSGMSFEGISRNCIRLNIPKDEQINSLIEIIQKMKL